jgi:hypothetical protein
MRTHLRQSQQGRRHGRHIVIAGLAAGVLLSIAGSAASARDCVDEARREMDTINQRAAAVSKNDDVKTLCRNMQAQIRSYELLIGLFRSAECNAKDPAAGIAQMTEKVTPLRTAYGKFCR